MERLRHATAFEKKLFAGALILTALWCGSVLGVVLYEIGF